MYVDEKKIPAGVWATTIFFWGARTPMFALCKEP